MTSGDISRIALRLPRDLRVALDVRRGDVALNTAIVRAVELWVGNGSGGAPVGPVTTEGLARQVGAFALQPLPPEGVGLVLSAGGPEGAGSLNGEDNPVSNPRPPVVLDELAPLPVKVRAAGTPTRKPSAASVAAAVPGISVGAVKAEFCPRTGLERVWCECVACKDWRAARRPK